MFKNAAIFKITIPDFGPVQSLEEGAANHVFTPCGLTEERSVGWVPPRGHENGALVECMGTQIIMRLMVETKSVPAQVINDDVDAECKAIEAMTGRKPGKKEKRDLKDDARLKLLPYAFPVRTAVWVWIDLANHRLVLDTSSQSRCDTVVTHLVQLVDGIAVSYLNCELSPASIMTSWLYDRDMLSTGDRWGFDIGRACELKASDESKAVVRYTRHKLDTDEVKQHINQGKMATKLALTYNDRVSCTLTDSGTLTGLSFLDVVFENTSAGDGAADRFDADVAILTGELSKLIPDLIDALGGEVQS